MPELFFSNSNDDDFEPHPPTAAASNAGEGDDAATTPPLIALTVTAELAGLRLDKFITVASGRVSRMVAARIIKEGLASVDGNVAQKPAEPVQAGQQVVFALPPPSPPKLQPEAIPLDIIFEDADLIVVNKSAGMVTHPATTFYRGTLANALAYHFAKLSDFHGDPTRVGIVHRLDRDTSGVILCAKDEWVHYKLSRQFEKRLVTKRYLAIVYGRVEFDETIIDAPLARHPKHREMMHVAEHGREAVTRVVVLERFRRFTFVECFPKTGRTHQIRVHLLSLGHPIVADFQYARTRRPPRWADFGLPAPSSAAGSVPGSAADSPTPDIGDVDVVAARREWVLPRQALHAASIAFTHPRTHAQRTFSAPLPSDMQVLLDLLRAEQSRND